MKKTKQIFLLNSKLVITLACILLFVILSLHHKTATATEERITNVRDDSNQKNIHILYSPASSLQFNIAEKITTQLRSHSITNITHSPPNKVSVQNKHKTQLIIAIGADSIKYASVNYSDNDTLLIASSPGEYPIDKKIDETKAVLFMSQSYCRQIHFIKEINQHWTTISYLDNKESPINNAAINQCAKTYGMNMYEVNAKRVRTLTRDIKKALSNSDLILALPNKTIYNSQSVKNILLTSYRSRKPVIGFSKSFVRAGALASIYSNTEQIAHSASDIIEKYYKDDNSFKQKISHPKLFNIEINKQVFRALNLAIPNTKKIKQTLTHSNHKSSGEPR